MAILETEQVIRAYASEELPVELVGEETTTHDEECWLSIIERLRDEIYELEGDKEHLENEVDELKSKNHELVRHVMASI